MALSLRLVAEKYDRGYSVQSALSHEEWVVLAVFDAACKAGLGPVSCYKAGVRAWRSLHPDHARTYSAQRAVTIMLAARILSAGTDHLELLN
jgi:hypothetical protein